MKDNVEKKAIRAVMQYELTKGNNPKDVSKDKNHKGYDIISNQVKIEVKCQKIEGGPHLLLNENNIRCIENSNEKDYLLCGVINAKKKPKIILFKKSDILKIKQEKRIWRIPLGKKDYLGAEEVEINFKQRRKNEKRRE